MLLNIRKTLGKCPIFRTIRVLLYSFSAWLFLACDLLNISLLVYFLHFNHFSYLYILMLLSVTFFIVQRFLKSWKWQEVKLWRTKLFIENQFTHILYCLNPKFLRLVLPGLSKENEIMWPADIFWVVFFSLWSAESLNNLHSATELENVGALFKSCPLPVKIKLRR